MIEKEGISMKIRVMSLLKALVASYLVTGAMLMFLAFMVYRFHWDEQMTTIGIVGTYVLSTFVAGFILGKVKQSKRFVWGLFAGVLYFALLIGISYGVYQNPGENGASLLTTFGLCAGGGMLGGMLA